MARPLQGAPGYLAAEIAYAAAAEGALHLDDALARRTRISFETVHRGVDSAAHAADIMGDVAFFRDTSDYRFTEWTVLDDKSDLPVFAMMTE